MMVRPLVTLFVVLCNWAAWGLLSWMLNQPDTLTVSVAAVLTLALAFANVWILWLVWRGPFRLAKRYLEDVWTNEP